MHFGDGSFKLIEVTETDPDDAVEAAATWVNDNAWFEAHDEQDEVVATATL